MCTYTIGKINKKIYKCITDDMITDEVIITEIQIKHIQERHPNDYERFSLYFEEIVKFPDYIVETNKPDTALILKKCSGEKEVFKMVLRLATSKDNPKYKKLTTPVQALKFCARFLRHRSQNLPFLLVITSRNAGYRSYFVSTSTYNRICLIVLLFLYF